VNTTHDWVFYKYASSTKIKNKFCPLRLTFFDNVFISWPGTLSKLEDEVCDNGDNCPQTAGDKSNGSTPKLKT